MPFVPGGHLRHQLRRCSTSTAAEIKSILQVGKCKQHEYHRNGKNLQNEIITLCTLVVWTVFYSVIQRCVLLLVCSSILLVLNASLFTVGDDARENKH